MALLIKVSCCFPFQSFCHPVPLVNTTAAQADRNNADYAVACSPSLAALHDGALDTPSCDKAIGESLCLSHPYSRSK